MVKTQKAIRNAICWPINSLNKTNILYPIGLRTAVTKDNTILWLLESDVSALSSIKNIFDTKTNIPKYNSPRVIVLATFLFLSKCIKKNMPAIQRTTELWDDFAPKVHIKNSNAIKQLIMPLLSYMRDINKIANKDID